MNRSEENSKIPPPKNAAIAANRKAMITYCVLIARPAPQYAITKSTPAVTRHMVRKWGANPGKEDTVASAKPRI